MAEAHEASYYFGTNEARHNCPCSQNSPQNSTLQSLIGDDYFCESGNPVTDGSVNHHIFYTSDPLWNGKDVVFLKAIAVQLLDFHGSIKSFMLPLLTTLN